MGLLPHRGGGPRAPGAPVANSRDYRDPKNKENGGGGRSASNSGSLLRRFRSAPGRLGWAQPRAPWGFFGGAGRVDERSADVEKYSRTHPSLAGSRGGMSRGLSGPPPRPFRGGPMHHVGGPMGAGNMNMGPRGPAPMMGSLAPGPRVGRGGLPGAPGNPTRGWGGVVVSFPSAGDDDERKWVEYIHWSILGVYNKSVLRQL